MTKNSFHNQRDTQSLDKLRLLTEELPQFCQVFFVGIQNRTTPLTRLNYAYDFRIFFEFFVKTKRLDLAICQLTISHLNTLTSFDIELFLDYLNNYTHNGKVVQCGQRAKERKLCSLRTLIKYFFKKDMLTSDVAAKVSSVKIKQKEIVRLEVDEVVKLLDMVEGSTQQASNHQKAYFAHTRLRDLAILTLFLGTGIRVSELVGLDYTDIDFANNSFVVTRKGGSRAILHFGHEVSSTLQSYLEQRKSEQKDIKQGDNNALFVSMQGSRLSVRAVQMLVTKFAKIVSPLKKISPHKLRSTYGTALYRETQDIYVVAEVLGHKDVNTTKKHYAQSSEEIRRAAANKVKLRE